MVLPEFEYLAPDNLKDACALAKEHGEHGKVMAGGTDVIVAMKEKHIAPAYIIDIKNIGGLDYIDYDPREGLRIGALTKLRTIEKSQLVQEKFKAISDAAHYVASTQVRAKGTMVGNIVNASPSADTVPALIALRASLKVSGVEGDRVISMDEFYTGFKKTALQPGEIVTDILIPAKKENEHSAYCKHAVRKAMDLAIVGVAANLTVEGRVVKDARIVLGAVAVTAIRSPKAEAELIGNALTEEVIAKASVAAMEDCRPIDDVRASAEYRKDMVRVFTKRAIQKAMED